MLNSRHIAVEALYEALRAGPTVIWAVLKEDSYETVFGDGYYAYVDSVHLSEADAELAISAATEDGMKWHVRRYELAWNGAPTISPEPTPSEPTSIAAIAEKMHRAGLL